MFAILGSFAFPIGLWLLILGYEIWGLVLMVMGWGATLYIIMEMRHAEIKHTEEVSSLQEQNRAQPQRSRLVQ